MLARGSNFHTVIEHYLKGDPEPDSQLKEENCGYWESAQTVLRDITDVQSVEKIILHRDLCYKGQFDCIATYRWVSLIFYLFKWLVLVTVGLTISWLCFSIISSLPEETVHLAYIFQINTIQLYIVCKFISFVFADFSHGLWNTSVSSKSFFQFLPLSWMNWVSSRRSPILAYSLLKGIHQQI